MKPSHDCIFVDEKYGVDSREHGPLKGDHDLPRDNETHHWAQGPGYAILTRDTRLPTFPISPTAPLKSFLITTANLNIRHGPGTRFSVIGVVPAGTVVEATGATQGKWWRVVHDSKDALPVVGWCHSNWLSIRMKDAPRFTHQFGWSVKGDVSGEQMRAITSHLKDARGWQRAGVDLINSTSPQVTIEIVESACDGATACCYRARDGVAKIEISAHNWGRPEFARRVTHEMGHALGMMWDHYTGSVHSGQVYEGVMGNLNGKDGQLHAYPADFEIDDLIFWLQGEAPNVHEH